MARQVLPIVGAIVGAYFGSAQLGFAIGSILGNAVDPQVIKGPRIGEAGLQTSAEGVYRPFVIGKGAVKGNVIERGNRQVKTKRTQQGKGGPVTEEQRVYWTFAIRLAEPIVAVTRIWQDEKLVYDVTDDSPIPDESAEFAERFTLYLGDEDQLPDPDLEAYKGAGNVNAYRGTAYIVFPNFDLTDRRESIPDFRFEVVSSAVFHPPVAALILKDDQVLPSPDGLDWSADFINAGAFFSNVLSKQSRFVVYNAGTAHYTDDYGDTFIPSGGVDLGNSGGTRLGWWDTLNDRIVIPGGVNPMRVSYDRGETFSILSASPDSNAVAFANNLWFSYYQEHVAVSGSITFAEYEDVPVPLGGSIAIARASSGNLVKFGGHTPVPPYEPKIITMSGPGYAEDTVPPMPGATSITTMTTDRAGTWVAGDDAGHIYRSTIPGGWNYVEDLGVYVRDVVWNDSVFIVVGTDMSTGASVIKTSPTGAGGTWTTRRTLTVPVGQYLSAIASGPGLNSVSAEKVPLSAIVSVLHERIGQGSSVIDVTELTDEVEGIVFAGDYTAGDAIRTLMLPYFFDAAEYDGGSGYRIHYHKRGKPVVTTITLDDILELPEKTVREDALERPRVLHLHYENPTIGYAPAKATDRRDSPDVLVVGELSFQIPVSFTDVDEPRQIARKRMKIAWVEVGGEEQFVVHDGLLGLVPSDCIGVSIRGMTRRMRIAQQQISPGQISLRLIADRQSAYTASVTGVPVPPPTPPLPSIVGDTLFDLLDLPALTDNHDRLLWYEAATGASPAWYGAQTQRKIAPMTEFEDSARFNRGTVMGYLLEPLAAASEHYTDTTNTVRIQLYRDSDTLDSLTNAQFLSEGGAFAIKNGDGTLEVLQYRDVDDEGDGVFALTHLARGRLATGGSAHEEGARFALLEGVLPVDAVTAWNGAEVTSRAISFGASADGAPQQVNTYTARSQTEFPVAYLFGTRTTDSGSDVLALSAVPRFRFGTETNPIPSTNWMGYRWTVTDGVNSATLDTAPTAPAASFDVFGWGAITATVAQVNRFTGPGPTVSESFP